MNNILEHLTDIIETRKNEGSPDSSYVAQLHHKGLNKMLEKLGEENIEAIIAAKEADYTGKTEELVGEMADLWFHALVTLSYFNLDAKDVLNELARRFDLSGIEEKAARKKH